MARLTAADRRALPDRAFAGPDRSYPVPDAAHARSAIGFAAMHHDPRRAAITKAADEELGEPHDSPAEERGERPSLRALKRITR